MFKFPKTKKRNIVGNVHELKDVNIDGKIAGFEVKQKKKKEHQTRSSDRDGMFVIYSVCCNKISTEMRENFIWTAINT